MNAVDLAKAFRENKVAHLAIDLQGFYCDPGIFSEENKKFWPCARRGRRLAGLVENFADQVRPAAWNIWVYIDSKERGARDLIVTPKAPDAILGKPDYSAFYGTGLRGILEDAGKSVLLLSGLYKDKCVYLTALSAKNCGMDAIIVDDLAIWSTTTNLSADDEGVSHHLKSFTRGKLKGYGVQKMLSRDILALLPVP